MPFENKLILSPILVGRTKELEVLEAALRTVQEGSGQVVLVAGEAGVGKSRLAAEIRGRALKESFTVLEGQCFERDLLFPYAPLIDALCAFLAPGNSRGGADAVAELVNTLAPELVKLVPELALLIPDLQPTRALDPEAEKRRLFETVLHFLTLLTRRGSTVPLLLIFEDLHWCDETSLDFLHLLARRILTLPILLLVTYRSEEVSSYFRQFLSQLERGRLAQEVILRSLNRDEVDTLLQAILELGGPGRVELLEAVYVLTEGNPYFVEEVLKALIAAGDLFYLDVGWGHKSIQELHIPPSIQASVQRRTQQLSVDARQILILAAVTGRRFDFALLQQISARAEHELLSLLRQLVTAHLVIEESVDRFAFRHALIRQAVYAELMARERQALHRTIGITTESLYARSLDTRVADLSYHFYEAGEWDKALHYAVRAGEEAQALYAPRAAVEHFTRALAAARHWRQAPSGWQLYRARGLAYETLGDFEQARTDLEMALELARAVGDRDAEWQALLDLGKLWASRNYAQTGDYYRRALDLARTLDHPNALAHSLNYVGNWHLNVEQPLDALRYHQQALAIFQTQNDQHGLAQTFDLLATASYIGGNPVHGAANFRHAIALFQNLDDRQGLVSSQTMLSACGLSYTTEAVVAAEMDSNESIHWSERAQQIARQIGWRAGEASALVISAFSLGAQGQYEQALESVHRGLKIAQEIEHRQWICMGHRGLGALYADLLAMPAARRHLEHALSLANEIGSLYQARIATAGLISISILEHDLVQAEALLEAVFNPDLPMQTLAQRWIWRGRVELALAQGDADLAVQITDQLLATMANRDENYITAIPYLTKLRGKALVALQRWTEAEASLLAARAAAQAQGSARLVWRIDVALGSLYQTQGQQAKAADAFTAAKIIVEQSAVKIPDIELRENFLYQTRVLMPQLRSRSSLQIDKKAFGGLTRRERQVAILIAQGKSNRAIAEALVLGERTVEGHVGNILSKLASTSRAQIAAWAVEIGLTK